MIFYLVTGLAFALALLLEGSVLSFFIIEQALPDLFLVMVISLGYMMGEKRGAALGFCAGLMQDIIFGSALGFFALAKMLLGYGAGRLGRELYQDQLLAPTLLTFAGTLIHEFLLYFLVNQFIGLGLPMQWTLSRFFIPKALYNTAFALVIYPLFYRLYFYKSKPDFRITARGRRY